MSVNNAHIKVLLPQAQLKCLKESVLKKFCSSLTFHNIHCTILCQDLLQSSSKLWELRSLDKNHSMTANIIRHNLYHTQYLALQWTDMSCSSTKHIIHAFSACSSNALEQRLDFNYMYYVQLDNDDNTMYGNQLSKHY